MPVCLEYRLFNTVSHFRYPPVSLVSVVPLPACRHIPCVMSSASFLRDWGQSLFLWLSNGPSCGLSGCVHQPGSRPCHSRGRAPLPAPPLLFPLLSGPGGALQNHLGVLHTASTGVHLLWSSLPLRPHAIIGRCSGPPQHLVPLVSVALGPCVCSGAGACSLANSHLIKLTLSL